MKKLKQLQAQLADRLKIIDAIEPKVNDETATTEELADLKKAVDEAKALKAEIAELTSLHSDIKGLQDVRQPVAGAPVQTLSGGGGDPDSGLTKVGTAVVEKGPRGGFAGMVLDAAEEFGITEILEANKPAYKLAFHRVLTKGLGGLGKTDLTVLHSVNKNLNETGVDERGGILVPTDFLLEPVRQSVAQTGLINEVRVVPTGSGSVTAYRANDSGDDIYTNPFRVRLAGEGRRTSEPQGQQFEPQRIEVYEGTQRIPFTRATMEDNPAFVQNWIRDMFFENAEPSFENFILNGTGVGEPWGIIPRALAGAFNMTIRNAGNPVVPTNLTSLFYRLPAQYRQNSVLVMNSAVFGDLASATDANQNQNNLFGVTSRTNGAAVELTETFRGKRIVFSELMPNFGANNLFAIHADLRRSYIFVRRMAVTMGLRDLADEDPVAVFRHRFGGDVLLGRACNVWRQA